MIWLANLPGFFTTFKVSSLIKDEPETLRRIQCSELHIGQITRTAKIYGFSVAGKIIISPIYCQTITDLT